MSLYALIVIATAAAAILSCVLLKSLSPAGRSGFSLDDRKFGDAALAHLSDAELKRLLNIGTWETLPAGAYLTEQGSPVDALYFLGMGKAEVSRDGKPIARMLTGRFVGEMTCLTGEPATATVRLLAQTRVLRLPAQEYREMISKQPEIREHMQLAFARDIARKMSERARIAASELNRRSIA